MGRGSRAGASSMSPVLALKQAVARVLAPVYLVNVVEADVELTAVPRTRQPARMRQDAVLQRRAVVRALGPNCLDLAISIDDEYLCTLDALNFGLDLFAQLQVE